MEHFKDLFQMNSITLNIKIQKQPPTSIHRKRCSEKMQEICRRTPMPKCDFTACMFSCKFAASFRTPFPNNTSGRLLLKMAIDCVLDL